MATYRRVYDSRHLQADCKEPGSAAKPYARQSSMGYLYLFYLLTPLVSMSTWFRLSAEALSIWWSTTASSAQSLHESRRSYASANHRSRTELPASAPGPRCSVVIAAELSRDLHWLQVGQHVPDVTRAQGVRRQGAAGVPRTAASQARLRRDSPTGSTEPGAEFDLSIGGGQWTNSLTPLLRRSAYCGLSSSSPA